MAEATASSSSDSPTGSSSMEGKPTCVICLGMAGSGKTTFVQVGHYSTLFSHRPCMTLFFFLQRINAHLHARKKPPYVVNLDPAVYEVPYPTNIGNFKEYSWALFTRHTDTKGNGVKWKHCVCVCVCTVA